MGISYRLLTACILVFLPAISVVWGDDSVPSHTTVRSWSLRYGFDRLNSKKNFKGDVCILLDHTVKSGGLTCLIAVAVELNKLRARGDFTVTFSDLTPLIIFPSAESTGEQIYEQMEIAAFIAGLEYFSGATIDGAGNLCKASGIYCKKHKRSKMIREVVHKKGTLMKASLINDSNFSKYCKLYNYTKLLLKQSQWAALAPSHQRKKGRFLNIIIMIDWAKMILKLLRSPDLYEIPGDVIKKLRWVLEFEDWIFDVDQRLHVCEIAESQIIKNGMQCKSAYEYKMKLKSMNLRSESKKISEQMYVYLREYGKGIPKKKPLIGCTTILESLIGKMKSMDRGPSERDFGPKVLLGAAIISPPTPERVKESLERTKTSTVANWISTTFQNSIDYVGRRLRCIMSKGG
jgi:hypothetical protein